MENNINSNKKCKQNNCADFVGFILDNNYWNNYDL